MEQQTGLILKHDFDNKALNAIRTGSVKEGLGIGIDKVDEHLRFKKGQFVMINGHDNVGKTDWVLWYFVVLAKKHGLKFDIFSSENTSASVKTKIIQFWTGRKLLGMREEDFYRYSLEITNSFNFFRNDLILGAKEILNACRQTESSAVLIDPFNSLKVETANKHKEDYEICSEIRVFCNQTKKSVYVNAHLVTEAARRVYPKDHPNAGHLSPPEKADTEGGQKFANRADDFISIHRMTQHEQDWNKTEVHIRKVKETMTGGGVTMRDSPMKFKLENYSSFTIDGVDALSKPEPEQTQAKLTRNYDY